MSEFKVNLKTARREIDVYEKLTWELDSLQDILSNTKRSLSFEIAQKQRVQKRLEQQESRLFQEKADLMRLSVCLDKVLQQYEKTEMALCNFQYQDGLEYPNDSDNMDNPDASKNKLSFEKALDFLEYISKELNVNGAILSVIEAILDLSKTVYDTKIVNAFDGLTSSITGLVIDIAADIMNAYENDLSENALFADLIVDVALVAVGEGAECLGGAIGSAVAPVGGTIVGKVVGGLIGNGVSTVMNIDWNGEEEGGSGKDAVSDWIDDLLDKCKGDDEIQFFDKIDEWIDSEGNDEIGAYA